MAGKTLERYTPEMQVYHQSAHFRAEIYLLSCLHFLREGKTTTSEFSQERLAAVIEKGLAGLEQLRQIAEHGPKRYLA